MSSKLFRCVMNNEYIKTNDFNKIQFKNHYQVHKAIAFACSYGNLKFLKWVSRKVPNVSLYGASYDFVGRAFGHVTILKWLFSQHSTIRVWYAPQTCKILFDSKLCIRSIQLHQRFRPTHKINGSLNETFWKKRLVQLASFL
jgi:hypothetical protein